MLFLQAAALPRIWQHSIDGMGGVTLQQATLRRSLQCSASAADAAASQVAPSSNGALSNIIDTELKAEAEQSYLAVRSIRLCRISES